MEKKKKRENIATFVKEMHFVIIKLCKSGMYVTYSILCLSSINVSMWGMVVFFSSLIINFFLVFFFFVF